MCAFFNGGVAEVLIHNYGVPYVIGSYTGDGTSNRAIALGCTPSALLIFTEDTSKEEHSVAFPLNGGFVKQGEAVTHNGIDLVKLNGSTLTVSQWTFTPASGAVEDMYQVTYNKSGTEYKYIAFRGENGFAPESGGATLKELELIASGETTEAVNEISITADNDGNPFELRDMVTMYAYAPTAEQTSALSVKINDEMIVHQIANAVKSDGERYSRATLVYSGKKWDAYAYSVEGKTANGTVTTRDRFGYEDASTITSIKLYLYNSAYVLPAGFKYEIYGRRV